MPASKKVCTPSGAVAVPDVSIPDVTQIEQGAGLKKRKATSTDADVGNRKRSKASPTPASPPSNPSAGGWNLSPPAGAPVWVTKAINLFARDNFGAKWQGLVNDWVQYEDALGFATSGRLGSKGHPQAVADWIQRARSETFRPVINASKFKTDFWNWWTGLQPSWRLADEPALGEGQSDDWEGLDGIKGTNGLVSVIAALAFWRSGLPTDGTRSNALTEWVEAVDDVHQVVLEFRK